MLWKTLTAGLLLALVAPAALAENPDHLRKLLSTKSCVQCNLVNAGLVMGELAGANLSQANLIGANLSQANLTGANLRGANLTGASLYGANLSGADLTGAVVNGTDLRESFLSNANLSGTNLQAAYLQGAIGLSAQAGSATDFTNWAYLEWDKNNYTGAIQHFNQAIRLNPKMAPAYLGRSMARYRLQDDAGAIADATKAQQLFTAVGDIRNAQSAQNIIKGIELANQPSKPSQGGGGSLVDVLTGLSSMLLKFF
jgi:uncharacterized protein YjbI with pentapeptide repeats